MVWGKRSGYAVFGMLLGGVGLASFGGCSDGESKRRTECGPGETRVCVQQGVSENCSCLGTGTAGTGPTLDSGGGSGGGSSGSGPAGTGGSGGAAGGRPIIDGALGNGGALGTGASDGAAGTNGASGTGGTAPGTGRLGAACGSNVDCGAGLTCLPATSTALGGEGPARGLCTMNCAGDAAACSQFGSGAVCLNFGADTSTEQYCVQGCTFGPVGSSANPDKCHGRNEVACAPLFGATGAACTTDANCPAGQLCDGQCYVVIPACLPQCNADSDCGTGAFCNPQTGLCRATAKTGLPFGEECTEPPSGGSDACRGTCTGFVASPGAPATIYICTESCTTGVFPSCGWSGPASGMPAPGACLLASTLIIDRGGPGTGDRGMCAQLCDCNADCLHSSLVCIPEPALHTSTRRRGFCSLAQGDPGIPNCTP